MFLEYIPNWVYYFLGIGTAIGFGVYLIWKDEIDSMLSDLWNKS